MPLYEMTNDAFRAISPTTIAELQILERNDLQRLHRTQIEEMFILDYPLSRKV